MPFKKETVYEFPDGTKLQLFPVGELAYRLGRKTQAIRKWEIAGWLPKTPFSDSRGCRLYSEEMIRAIVRCAEKENIVPGRSMTKTKFAKLVKEEFEKIVRKYRRRMNVDPVQDKKKNLHLKRVRGRAVGQNS